MPLRVSEDIVVHRFGCILVKTLGASRSSCERLCDGLLLPLLLRNDETRIEIPREVARALRIPPEAAKRKVLKELALALYARQILPLGKARYLAGMTRRDFEDLLGERHIFPDKVESFQYPQFSCLTGKRLRISR